MLLLLRRRSPIRSLRIGNSSTTNPVAVNSVTQLEALATAVSMRQSRDAIYGRLNREAAKQEVSSELSQRQSVGALEARRLKAAGISSAVLRSSPDGRRIEIPSMRVPTLPPRRWNGLLLIVPGSPAQIRPIPSPTTAPFHTPAQFVAPAGDFPTQYAGFRLRKTGSTLELCLVALADAPSGMGGQMRFKTSADTKAVYLVETTDPNASPLHIQTGTGIKSVRLKT